MNAEQNDLSNEVAERFGCDPELLQQTMERIQAGEISPAAATELLLSRLPAKSSPAKSSPAKSSPAKSSPAKSSPAKSSPAKSSPAKSSPATFSPASPSAASATAAGETLALLIGRLGTPPEDIVVAWCQQLRVAAVTHFCQTGQPLPPIDPNQWTINPSGQLQCRGICSTENAGAVKTSGIDSVSADHIDQFHKSLVPVPSPQAAPIAAAEIGNQPGQDASLRESTSRSARPKRKKSPLRRFVLGGLIVAGITAIAGILIHASQNAGHKAKNTIAHASQPANVAGDPGITDTNAPSRINTSPVDSNAPVTSELETIDGPALDETSSDVVSLDEPILGSHEELLSLDALIPKSPDAIAADRPPETTSAATAGDKSALPKFDSMPMDPLTDDDGPGPEESPQVTRTSQVRSVQLPPLDDVDAATALTSEPTNELQLEFPFDVALKRRQTDRGSEIVDIGKDVAVGLIESREDGAAFSWSPQASKIPTASSLAHGRLKVASGDVIYLRPTIEADPWPIDLERHDVRPTWDLLAPMPPRVTRLSIEFQLPKEVEEGWIEQIDSTSPRRARGLAVLTPREGDSVSLGMRFDIRGGRKLSCRVRYAARLGPEAPWQAVSRPMLEQLADQLVAQSRLNSKQLTHMAAIYSAADTDGRRVLRPRRDAIEQQGESLRAMSERVVQLQSLLAQVEATGTLKLRVWVSWPDGEQTLLATKSPE